MKTIFKISGAVAIAALAACSSNSNKNAGTDTVTTTETTTARSTAVVPGRYVDLSSGQEVQVIADPETGYAVNSETGVPVELYVNTSTGDTLYRTGIIVNNAVIQDGTTWRLNDEMIERDGDNIKVKTDPDGDMKVKNEAEDTKVKVEADGEVKVKTPDSKTKVEEDGEVKTKERD